MVYVLWTSFCGCKVVSSHWFELVVMSAIIINTLALASEYFQFKDFAENWHARTHARTHARMRPRVYARIGGRSSTRSAGCCFLLKPARRGY